MVVRERVIWRGEVVTVVERSRLSRTVTIRDGFGYTHAVRKRDVSPLRADDERRTFNA